jgi:hypothetical protein
MTKTLEDLAKALDKVDKNVVGDHKRLEEYGGVLETIQAEMPLYGEAEALCILYETLENLAKAKIKAQMIDLADYYGVDISA